MYGPKGMELWLLCRMSVRTCSLLTLVGSRKWIAVRNSGTAVMCWVCSGLDFMTKSDTRQELEKGAILQDLFWQTLVDSDIDVALNGPDFDSRHICNLNVSFKHKSAKAILDILQPNVCASSGAACVWS